MKLMSLVLNLENMSWCWDNIGTKQWATIKNILDLFYRSTA